MRIIGYEEKEEKKSRRHRVEVTRCYLVQVLDENGYEVDYEYVFDNRGEAMERGRELKRQVLEGVS